MEKSGIPNTPDIILSLSRMVIIAKIDIIHSATDMLSLNGIKA